MASSTRAPSLPPFPPMMAMLSRDTEWASAHWCHGSRSSSLSTIRARGLLPRAEGGTQGNWEKHPSAPHMVYLTSAYGLHFANACEDPGFPAIMEIDTSGLDQARFFADEDSYALSKVKGMPQLETLSLEERVAFWRERLEDTDPNVGLQVLGNVCYKGRIPPQAVKAVRLLTVEEAGRLTVGVFDPVISPGNFKLLGGLGQRLNKWLVGHETELNSWFQSVCPLSLPVMTLEEAAAFAKSHRT